MDITFLNGDYFWKFYDERNIVEKVRQPARRTAWSQINTRSPREKRWRYQTGLKLENYYFFTFTFSRPEVRKLLLFYVFTFSRPEVGKLFHISMV